MSSVHLGYQPLARTVFDSDRVGLPLNTPSNAFDPSLYSFYNLRWRIPPEQRLTARQLDVPRHAPPAVRASSLPPPPPALVPSTRASSQQMPLVHTIVFDWDDSLFPTTAMAGFNKSTATPLSALPETIRHQMHAIDYTAASVLRLASSMAPLYIVTNGSTAWFESSGSTYLPSTWACVRQLEHDHKLVFISARDMYEHTTSDPTLWKRYAFQNILKERMQSAPGAAANLLSIGDGPAEAAATHFLQTHHPVGTVYAKQVRLAQKPSLTTFLSELDHVGRYLKSWMADHHNVDFQEAG